MAKKKATKIKAVFDRERVLAENEGLAKDIHDQSRLGEIKEGKIQYALPEALFLLEKGKMESAKGMAELEHWMIGRLRDAVVGGMETPAADEIAVGMG